MQCSSPRASAGFSRLEASIAPSLLPAPISVCISSMNRMMSPSACLTSSSTPFSRSSNSPRYLAPAISAAHVERHQPPVLEAVGHVAIGDAQRQPFGDRGLADAGLADQHRIVLGAAGEDLDGAADFLVAADHRIELAVARRLGEVAGEFLQRVVAVLGRLRCRRCGRRAAALIAALSASALTPASASALPASVSLASTSASRMPLDRDVAVARLLRDLLGLVEHRGRVSPSSAGVWLGAAAGDRRDLGQRLVGLAPRRLGAAAGARDQARRHALLVLEQRLQQMRRRDPLMVHAERDGLRRLQEAARAVGEFFEVHVAAPFCAARYGVALLQHKGPVASFVFRPMTAKVNQMRSERYRVAKWPRRYGAASNRRLIRRECSCARSPSPRPLLAGLCLAPSRRPPPRRPAPAPGARSPTRPRGRHPLPAIHPAERPARHRPRGPQGAGGRGLGLVPCRLEGRARRQDRLRPSVRASDVRRLRA